MCSSLLKLQSWCTVCVNATEPASPGLDRKQSCRKTSHGSHWLDGDEVGIGKLSRSRCLGGGSEEHVFSPNDSVVKAKSQVTLNKSWSFAGDAEGSPVRYKTNLKKTSNNEPT